MLDVDLDLAQSILRLEPARWPLPPCGAPPVMAKTWDGALAELLPAIPAAAADEPPPVARESAAPRGAYARRAAART